MTFQILAGAQWNPSEKMPSRWLPARLWKTSRDWFVSQELGGHGVSDGGDGQGLEVEPTGKSGQQSTALDRKTKLTSWHVTGGKSGGVGLYLGVQNGIWKVSEVTLDNWEGTWRSQNEVQGSISVRFRPRAMREREPHYRWGYLSVISPERKSTEDTGNLRESKISKKRHAELC